MDQCKVNLLLIRVLDVNVDVDVDTYVCMNSSIPVDSRLNFRTGISPF